MAHRHSVTENPGQLVGIAAIAAAIGAAFAIMFTPRTGDQARRGIRRRAEHVRDDMRDRFSNNDGVADMADDAKTRLQSTVDKVVSDTKSTVRKAKSDAAATKNDAQDAAEEAVRSRQNRS